MGMGLMAVWQCRLVNTIKENTHNHSLSVVEVVLGEAVRVSCVRPYGLYLMLHHKSKNVVTTGMNWVDDSSHLFPYVETIAYAQGVRDTSGRDCIHYVMRFSTTLLKI